MKVCITGATGFVGVKLAEALLASGHEVLRLDRKSFTHHFPVHEYVSCDAVIHLAGTSIFGRWTKSYKESILKSRIDTTDVLIETIKKAGYGPKIFICASAIGYYGEGGENELDETSKNGTDFLATVCKQWEDVAKKSEEIGLRWVSVRTGVVLGSEGGMLSKLIPIYKWGFGGPIGNGKQWFSWIYLQDLLDIYKVALEDNHISGVINAVAPQPVTAKTFAKKLGKTLSRPALCAVPIWALKLLYGDMAESIAMSQKVIPKKLIEYKFNFIAPDIETALKLSCK